MGCNAKKKMKDNLKIFQVIYNKPKNICKENNIPNEFVLFYDEWHNFCNILREAWKLLACYKNILFYDFQEKFLKKNSKFNYIGMHNMPI